MWKNIRNFLRKDSIWILTVIIAFSNYYSYKTSKNSERKYIIENNITFLEKIYYNPVIKDVISLRTSLSNLDYYMAYCSQENIPYQTTCEKYPYISEIFLPFREHISNKRIDDVFKLNDDALSLFLSLNRMGRLLNNLPKEYSLHVDKFYKNIKDYIVAYRNLRLFLLLGCPNYSFGDYKNLNECVDYINDISLDTLRVYSDDFINSSNKLYDSYNVLSNMIYLQLDKF